MDAISVLKSWEKMNRFALLNFKIFWGQCPRPQYWGGASAPLPDSTHSALGRFAPPCLARGLRPLHRPSLCVVDILRYFRVWCKLAEVVVRGTMVRDVQLWGPKVKSQGHARPMRHNSPPRWVEY